ncbi:Hint domain-containing protein [Pseudorhodobacter sp.]|uniref:Hint domain-containing protein n=1 Tax=Pseudorhodobacter sp. TaxID=1934400 RepID=UPI0026479FE0|nr:Hint domain-containing protein [Pseudorhodobacter sp.]MDN5786245.1 Hint domain-containing protein [Pseudorhodobacter sp.]
MAVYSFLAFSNSDLGRPGTSINTGTFTVSGTPAVMNIRDNDPIFDDEANTSGQTLDTSRQTLNSAFDGLYTAGRLAQSVYSYTLTNNTTGQTGTAYLIRIYNGTTYNNNGGQNGEYYNAFSIRVHPGDNITLSAGNYIGQTAYSNLVICFRAGTMIATPKGPRPVEDLRPDDFVTTRDNGAQPLRWIGKRTVAAKDGLAPITIAAGTLDNSHDLSVSPNHRMLISATSNDLHFGTDEVFVAAKYLLGNPGVSQCSGGKVTYVHLLFDQHEVVFANGTPSESFFPGANDLNALDSEARHEVLTLFPELPHQQSGCFKATARLCLTRQESRLLHRTGLH